MDNKITLKTGQVIKLEWNYLVLQTIEQEVGSLNNLTNEYIENNEIKVFNIFAYAVIQAGMDEEITLRQAIRLIEFGDMEKIAKFVEKELMKAEKVAEVKNSTAQTSLKK